MRTFRYREIAEALQRRLDDGEFRPGHLLPSESVLSSEYDASRVTIRKALEALRSEGLVQSRQGLGWSVATDPLRQRLGRLGTIEAQLADSGRDHTREVLEFRFAPADPEIEAILHTARVLIVRRLSRTDGQPFAQVTIWCPEHLATDISLADVERQSFQELLGPAIGGATQTIAASLAAGPNAEALAIPDGSPVLIARRTTVDTGGSPVLVSEHVFPGHLTEFVAELPGPQPSAAPSGLRLVDRDSETG